MTVPWVSVITGTFGDDRWKLLAERAGASVPDGVPWIHVHGESLHAARNAALAQVETPFMIGLDADDELTGQAYIDAMARGSADIRACAVSYIKPNGRAHEPYVPRVANHHHECWGHCLPEGNFVAIGACVRTTLLREVGGYESWPVYEDWAAVLRMWKAGASVESIPDAVYRAWMNPQSRNRAPDMATKNRVHHEIVAAVLGDQEREAA